jgi:hypothetical protein
MIKFKCPHCSKEVSAGDENAGKKGRCPGCKGIFVIPGKAAAKPAPAAERRTPPADYDPDDPNAVDELKRRVGVKVVKRQPDQDEDEAPPSRKRPTRDEDEDEEAISESPRKRRPARDEKDDEDEPRARRKRSRDEDDDEEPRARRKRDRDEDEDEEDDRPRRKRKKRRGQYANCPDCGARGDATAVGFTWWGGIIGPRLFSHVRCNRCGTCYNGKTGNYNTTAIAIYVAVGVIIGLGLAVLGIIANAH